MIKKTDNIKKYTFYLLILIFLVSCDSASGEQICTMNTADKEIKEKVYYKDEEIIKREVLTKYLNRNDEDIQGLKKELEANYEQALKDIPYITVNVSIEDDMVIVSEIIEYNEKSINIISPSVSFLKREEYINKLQKRGYTCD